MSPADLIEFARQARKRAYAPYSGYSVGAAIEGVSGKVYDGCNVENVSYGLTVCGERTAAVKMVSEGERRLRQVAVATEDGGTPCGICLQTLFEFAEDPAQVKVFAAKADGTYREFTLRELLPHGFTSGHVSRTEMEGL